MTSPRTSYLRPLVALVALVAAMGALLIAYNASPANAAPVCSTTLGTTTCTFSSTGAEDTFVVPAGVSSVQVVATGAPGAEGAVLALSGGSPAPGGRGAVVSGNLTGLTPLQTLYVNVGGAPSGGDDCAAGIDCIGGFNGGGFSGNNFAGGGGGASDVRTQPRTVPLASDDSRLIVAAGGGGGGAGGTCNGPASSRALLGGSGGDAVSDGGVPAGSDGGDGESCLLDLGTVDRTLTGGTGGKAGTQSAGGAGGIPGGLSGSLGQGGQGAPLGGGGGGGGYYGGGGGGAGAVCGGTEDCNGSISAAGGGGGGSNLVPQGGSATLAQDTSVAPSVTISYRTGGVGEEPPTEQPQTKAECKKGGWKEFGYKNQGQCIKAVNHPS
jgi:hypothetical protein